jgi:hypothetical protein
MGLEFGGMEQINQAVPNRRARAGLELFGRMRSWACASCGKS